MTGHSYETIVPQSPIGRRLADALSDLNEIQDRAGNLYRAGTPLGTALYFSDRASFLRSSRSGLLVWTARLLYIIAIGAASIATFAVRLDIPSICVFVALTGFPLALEFLERRSNRILAELVDPAAALLAEVAKCLDASLVRGGNPEVHWRAQLEEVTRIYEGFWSVHFRSDRFEPGRGFVDPRKYQPKNPTLKNHLQSLYTAAIKALSQPSTV